MIPPTTPGLASRFSVSRRVKAWLIFSGGYAVVATLTLSDFTLRFGSALHIFLTTITAGLALFWFVSLLWADYQSAITRREKFIAFHYQMFLAIILSVCFVLLLSATLVNQGIRKKEFEIIGLKKDLEKARTPAAVKTGKPR